MRLARIAATLLREQQAAAGGGGSGTAACGDAGGAPTCSTTRAHSRGAAPLRGSRVAVRIRCQRPRTSILSSVVQRAQSCNARAEAISDAGNHRRDPDTRTPAKQGRRIARGNRLAAIGVNAFSRGYGRRRCEFQPRALRASSESSRRDGANTRRAGGGQGAAAFRWPISAWDGRGGLARRRPGQARGLATRCRS